MKEPQVLQTKSRGADSLWQLRAYELLFLMRIAIDALVAHLHAVRASWLLLTALRYMLLAKFHFPIAIPQILPTLTLRCLHIKQPPLDFLWALIRRFRTARLSSLRGESLRVSVGDMLCSIAWTSSVHVSAISEPDRSARNRHDSRIARVAGG